MDEIIGRQERTLGLVSAVHSGMGEFSLILEMIKGGWGCWDVVSVHCGPGNVCTDSFLVLTFSQDFQSNLIWLRNWNVGGWFFRILFCMFHSHYTSFFFSSQKRHTNPVHLYSSVCSHPMPWLVLLFMAGGQVAPTGQAPPPPPPGLPGDTIRRHEVDSLLNNQRDIVQTARDIK